MFDETFAEAWRLRYGSQPRFDFPALAKLVAHRSIREYEDRLVSEDVVAALVAAAQSAASSSNLQLWSVISVQDGYLRNAIADLAADQVHVRKAPWFFVFAADVYRLKRASQAVGESAGGLDYTEYLLMAAIDAALACERMVCAAEALGLGICYIGAVRNDPERLKKLLSLPDATIGLFGLCLGWPKEEDGAEIKPRFAQGDVWFREQYKVEVDASEYDERMKPFYVTQGMKGEVTWSMRSARRVDGSHMTGRDVLRGFLDKQGLGLR